MDTKKQFQEKGYCLVRSGISDEIRDLLTQYALFDEIQNFEIERDDHAQVPGSHSKYADPAMESLLLRLLDFMKENTGLDLIPTYSYYRVYRNNHRLDKHIDRPSCEISATICFNHSYDNKEYIWPIYIGSSEIVMNPGDVVIYKGCEIEHWRDSLDIQEDAWHVQGFFHYVDANGPYAEYRYDKRDHVGQINHVEKIKINNNKSYPDYIQVLK